MNILFEVVHIIDKNIKLRVSNIMKAFGGIQALKGVDFELRRGEIHALIGANGAGKSTLIKIINGDYSQDSGSIIIDNKEIVITSPECAKKQGISAVYQELTLINELSIAENIFLGKIPTDPNSKIKIIKWNYVYRKASEILKTLKCDLDVHILVKDLSIPQKQMVEIAKALAIDAKIFIFDEPTSSLTEQETANIFKTIQNLASQDYSIIYITHKIEELPEIADRVTVFKDGQNVGTIPVKEAPMEKLVKMMIGDSLKYKAKKSVIKGEKIIEINNFTRKPYFSDISFSIYKGELLGITGLLGSGRTKMVRTLFGLDKLQSGEIFINSKKVTINSPQDAKLHGIGFVTENRKEEGLILGHSVRDNISLTILNKLKKLFWLDNKKEKTLCNQVVNGLEIKITGLNQKVKNLSGGNQQKVVIAKWLVTNPKILILDEPTKGIDVGVKGQVYSILNRLINQGTGVVMISSEISEIIAVCDRVLIMSKGKIKEEISKDEMTHEKLLSSITSTSAIS